MGVDAGRADPLLLPDPIQTRAKGIRPKIRSVHEALGLIDDELPAELRSLSRWTFARALLVEARKSGKSGDIARAARQLRQALDNEGWLFPPNKKSADG